MNQQGMTHMQNQVQNQFAQNQPQTHQPAMELPLGLETKVQVFEVIPRDNGAFVLKMNVLSGQLCGSQVEAFFMRRFRNGRENYATKRLFTAAFGRDSSIDTNEIHLVGQTFNMVRIENSGGYSKYVEIFVPKDTTQQVPAQQQMNTMQVPTQQQFPTQPQPQVQPNPSQYLGDIPF